METFLVRELGYSWDEVHDEAEELDFAGPWEVFTSSAMIRPAGDACVLYALEAQNPVSLDSLTSKTGDGVQIVSSITSAANASGAAH